MLNWNDILSFASNSNPAPLKRVEKSEKEWREQLTDKQFNIARKKGTEEAHSGGLCNFFEGGVYTCVCCNSLLFDSTIKFDSKTGWPSFTQPIQIEAIKYEYDYAHNRERIEVICNACDAHLGHVFPDGPEPSGLRYCINSEVIQIEKNSNLN